MVYSNYVKQRILHLRRTGKSYSKIADHLASEGHNVTKPGISYFLKTYKETGSIARKLGSGGKRKKSRALLDFIDSQIEKDNKYHFSICSRSWNRRELKYQLLPFTAGRKSSAG